MKAEDIKIRDSFTGKEVYRCATFAHPITGKRQYVYGKTDAEVLAKLKILYEKAERQAYNNKPSDKSFSSYLIYSLRLTVLDERKNGNKRLTVKGTQELLDRLYKGSLVDISDMERIKEEDIIKTLEIAREFETKKEYGEFAERIFRRAFTLAKENGLNVVDDPKVFARNRLDPNRHRKEFCIYSPVEYDVIKKEMEKELSEKITGSLMCAYFSLMTGIEPEILANIKNSDVTDAGLFVKNSLYGDHLIRYGNDMMKEFAIQLRGGGTEIYLFNTSMPTAKPSGSNVISRLKRFNFSSSVKRTKLSVHTLCASYLIKEIEAGVPIKELADRTMHGVAEIENYMRIYNRQRR